MDLFFINKPPSMCLVVYRHCLLRPLDSNATDEIQMLHEFTCYGYEIPSLSASTIWVSVAVIAHRRNSVTPIQNPSRLRKKSTSGSETPSLEQIQYTVCVSVMDAKQTERVLVCHRIVVGLVCSFIVLHSISIAHANDIRILFSGD